MRLALVGLGLIGGSIARALAWRPDWWVVGWDPDRAAVDAALAAGALAAVAPEAEAASAGADLTVLAAPPLANLELVSRLGPVLASAGTTLSDVSSAQVAIAARAAGVPGLRFVGGHPMSGREARGHAAADAGLFRGRPWVVLPSAGATTTDVGRVRALAVACGAVPVELDAETHDRAVAAISHLPLVGSVALAETAMADADWPTARTLAAQGFRDATRLARGDAALGAGIAATNAVALAAVLRRYRETLATWQALLDELSAGALPGGAATEEVEARFRDVAARLQAMDSSA